MGMTVHPLAELFPLMQGAEFADLVASIRDNGQREPIVLDRTGRIIDGRNRWRACEQLGIEPRTRTLEADDDGDILRYVVDLNLRRRHLNESQRAMVAARLANVPLGGNQYTKGEGAQICAPISQTDAAQMLNVSRRIVQGAKLVRDKGAPELVAAVEAGSLPVSVAAKVAKDFGPDEQRAIVTEPDRAEAAYLEAKRDRNVSKLAERTAVAERQLGTRLYNVIACDPPWSRETWSIKGRAVGDASVHVYPTMTLDAIKALKVPAADDGCVLFLWTTGEHLRQAFDVLDAWGFEYKANAVWVKTDRGGMGYWFRYAHEPILLATKGSPPAPFRGTQLSSVIEAPRGRHSAKPDAFFRWADHQYPNTRKLDMFGRGDAWPGWDSWGNEAAAE